MKFTIDIEPTNRCNAKCHFCPRDMTPHQGLMGQRVFEQALMRAVEYRDLAFQVMDEPEVNVSLCGLGEPLLNRETPSFVRQVRDAGLECAMSSNASLLDEEAAHALLDAGLNRVFINVADVDEGYDEVYHLPFGRTRDNIKRFVSLAKGRCEVWVIIVNHHNDRDHVERMKDYWRSLGVRKHWCHDIINRGGSLFVDHMQYESYTELDRAREMFADEGVAPLCGVPFMNLFIGYDGQYYLCCSDWEKRAPLGSVFDESFEAVTRVKVDHARSREPVCRTCNHDPTNHLVDVLRAETAGEISSADRKSAVEGLVASSSEARAVADRLGVQAGDAVLAAPARRLIPVSPS